MSTGIQEHSFPEMGSLPIKQSDETLVLSIKEKMESISISRCIFRVSNKLKQDHNGTTTTRSTPTFVPSLVSIGPYHHANENLKQSKLHKWKYAFALLTRKPNLEATLQKCIKGLRELEHRASICYADKLNYISSEEFIEIMLIDGCFIIELLIRYSLKSLRRQGGDDPFFGHSGKISTLRLDMTLLENQIPFSVLQMLFSVAPVPEQCTQSLNELAFRFFKHIIPGDNSGLYDKFSQHGYHFLDMIRNHLLPVSQKMKPEPKTESSSSRTINCATNLKRSGLTLKENTEHPSALLDIIFTKRSVLTIPRIRIQQQTEALLGNLVEFEWCRNQVGDSKPGYMITSYVLLMHSLICCEKDIDLLEKKGIVRSYVADRKAIVDMFKRICSGVELKEDLYAELCKQVNGYKKKKWIQMGSIFKG